MKITIRLRIESHPEKFAASSSITNITYSNSNSKIIDNKIDKFSRKNEVVLCISKKYYCLCSRAPEA